jgi:hypothetical protein
MNMPPDEAQPEPTPHQTIGTLDSGEVLIFDIEEPIERYKREILKEQLKATNPHTYTDYTDL